MAGKIFALVLAFIAGLLIGSLVTGTLIMREAAISGDKGNYTVTVFNNDFRYE